MISFRKFTVARVGRAFLRLTAAGTAPESPPSMLKLDHRIPFSFLAGGNRSGKPVKLHKFI
jgi:hypothetical protein